MPKSKLDDGVLDLIKMIFDMNMIEQSSVKIGYDLKKLPLGQLDKETIMKGYEYLKKIETILNKKSISSQDRNELADLSSSFYTYIPHDFKF
jgi:poly [ADP-ribose] polymerase